LSTQAEILSAGELSSVLTGLRESGVRIGHCHGCFDVVHFGHLIHFAEARSLVDFLIVSITADENIRKGPGRPVFSENRRAYFLSQIRSVDAVMIDRSDTAESVIKLIQPSVYFKGSDYCGKLTAALEREVALVRSFGGIVHFTSGDRYSTTDTLKRLAET
jgi:rfaE bifunctional protein nucleotidyltransferase chain/domain